ncbi:hypothetical protein HYW46_05790 [Candidatus Daviesbacteria bacterium]|nr:hypothetical protein [Candidatus Daviesbacteria bacterium]
MFNLLKKPYIIFLSIFSVYILFLALVTRVIFIYHLSAQNLLLLGLLGIDFSLPFWGIYLFAIGSFLVFSLISFKLFPRPYSYYPLLIYAITPWFHYLTVARSVYIYLLFLTLISFFGLILIKQKKEKLGLALFLAGSSLSIYSFITPLFMYAILLCILKITKLLRPQITKVMVITFIVTIIPLGALIRFRPQAFENMYQNEVTIFSNPGLLSDSNRLQGDSKAMGFSYLAKLSENKYFYVGKYSLMKLLYQFTPSTYFTPEEKLLNFSFTPPLFLGFLIPFIYGFYKIIYEKNLRKYLLILPVLVLPSFLSQKIVNLNHLVIIGPAIILFSGYGLTLLSKRKILLLMTIVIVLTQILFTTLDIVQREDIRYHKNFGVNILNDLGRQ